MQESSIVAEPSAVFEHYVFSKANVKVEKNQGEIVMGVYIKSLHK